MIWQLVIGLGLVLFVFLSGVDWLMTFTLLQSDPSAFEANPLAAACLKRYGWSGLAVYKTAGVVVFAVAVGLIARRRPPVAGGVVGIGCGMLIVVTSYTHGLICQNYREENQFAATEWMPVVREDHHELYGFKIPKRCWFANDTPTSQGPRWHVNGPFSSPRVGNAAVHTLRRESLAPHRWPCER